VPAIAVSNQRDVPGVTTGMTGPTDPTPEPAPNPALPEAPAPTPTHRPIGWVVGVSLAVVALLVGGAALGLAVSDSSGATPQAKVSCGSPGPRLTVVGTGTASRPPDELTATLAVNSTAGSAKAALGQDNVQVAAVVSALTANDVPAADIATTDLNLQTMYAFPHGVPTITGYQVSNTVTATLRALATAGTAIDAVVAAGGNAVTINSLTFSFSHPSAVQDAARTDAVRQAVSHARAIALAAGERLGAVCSLNDQTQQPTQNQPNQDQDFAAATSAGVPVPLEAGTQSESDQVTLVYALRD
jgi:uncharacterized protein YggE